MSTPRLRIRFYPNDDTGPVKEFIDRLYADPQRRVSAARLALDVRTLAEFWPKTMNVSVRMLGGWEPLREIKRRCGGISYRIFFTVLGLDLWLLSAFEKKSERTPASELRTAFDRMQRLRRGIP